MTVMIMFFLALLVVNSLSSKAQTAPQGGCKGVPRADECKSPQSVLGLSQGLLPTEHARKHMPKTHPQGDVRDAS